MTQAIVPIGERIEQVMVAGNLSVLSAEERVVYYNRLCDSLGLNPLTKPFEYLTLQGKLVLYARKDATDQLRKVHGISIEIAERQTMLEAGIYIVTARASDRDGRVDEATGAVSIQKLTGEALANAMMKAETKAKRRVTLSIAGLGMLDETEVDDIPERDKRPAVSMPQPRRIEPPAPVDVSTGEFGAMHDDGGLYEDIPPRPMWPAFWAKTQELGYSEAQVRKYVNVDAETFDAMNHAGLQRVINELRAAAQQPALPA